MLPFVRVALSPGLIGFWQMGQISSFGSVTGALPSHLVGGRVRCNGRAKRRPAGEIDGRGLRLIKAPRQDGDDNPLEK